MFSSLLGYLMVAVLVIGWVAFGLCFVLRRRGGSGGGVAKREPVAMLGVVLQSVAFGVVWSVRRGAPTPVVAGHSSLDVAALLVATGLVLTRWPAFAAALALFAAGTAIRVRAEERPLAETFGERFDEYRARVPAVLPWRLGA